MIISSFCEANFPTSIFRSSTNATIIAVAFLMLNFGCCEVSIQTQDERKIQLKQISHQVSFNEHFARGLYENIPLEDPIQVFRYIFTNLDYDVKVLPTENYYYFNLTTRGRYIWGNLRLSPADRDQGVIHFAYFDYEEQSWYQYLRLTLAEGVVVKRIASLVYSVEFDNKRVIFHLNDLPQTSPDNLVLLDGEIFLGQAFDESGFYFSLVYSKNFKHFLWVFNEAGNNWYFINLGQDLFLHPLSSFVFFNDRNINRKVLVGVYAWNVQSNNYFDGPFDQLPDNFIHKTKFRTYLEEAYPETKGLVNNRGEYFGRDERVSVMPYLIYGSLNDVKSRLKECKRRNIEIQSFYQCLCKDIKVQSYKIQEE